jgi:uncharacterized protein YkwD
MPPRRSRLILPLLLAAALLGPAAAGARVRGEVTGHVQVRSAKAPAKAATPKQAPAPAPAAPQRCDSTDLQPAPENVEAIRDAILCLHNQIRAQNGLPALRANVRLERAAQGHSAAMVQQGFFEHTTPDGVSMVDRILGARYARPWQGWSLGENLAWGTGDLATPRGALDAWMNSPGHRVNVLRRTFKEVGVGIALGVPVNDAAGATYTVDFGVKR